VREEHHPEAALDLNQQNEPHGLPFLPEVAQRHFFRPEDAELAHAEERWPRFSEQMRMMIEMAEADRRQAEEREPYQRERGAERPRRSAEELRLEEDRAMFSNYWLSTFIWYIDHYGQAEVSTCTSSPPEVRF